MITILRPGQDPLEIDTILIDFDGTLASDRRVHPKAKDKIDLLSKRTKIYILAQGEKDKIEEVLRKVRGELIYLDEGATSQGKLGLLRQVDPGRTVAIGNGKDDALTFEKAALRICVLSREGTATEAFLKSDLFFPGILDALDFLLKPLRQKATLGI